MTLYERNVYFQFPIKGFLILSLWSPFWKDISFHFSLGWLMIFFLIFMLGNLKRFLFLLNPLFFLMNFISKEFNISYENIKYLFMVAFLPLYWTYILLFGAPFLGLSTFLWIPKEFLIAHIIASHMTYPLTGCIFIFYFMKKIPKEYQISFSD